MKSKLLIILTLLLLAACSQQKGFHLKNASSTDVIQKSIELKRADLELIFGQMPESDLLFLIDKNGTKIPAQLDDLDGDGKWDVLFTQVDLQSGESKFYTLRFNGEAIPFKTNIRFANINDASVEYETASRLTSNATEISQQYFQFEGPGWENDVVAFRNYFDARNGVDIFGKVTANMMLDSCGLKDGPSYHEMRTWGMDILKVANSLGAGAIALQTPSGLYRVGPNCEGTYNLIKEGPIRSLFDLDFKGIPLEGHTLNLKHRISIEAGNPYYKSQVWVDGIEDVKLVTGIVNLNSDTVYSKSNESVSYFYTYDNQAYDGEKLGMAILVPSKNLVVHTAPEEGEGITQTFYTVLPVSVQPIEFYFMAGWEKNNEVFKTKEGFEAMIGKEAAEISTPIYFIQ